MFAYLLTHGSMACCRREAFGLLLKLRNECRFCEMAALGELADKCFHLRDHARSCVNVRPLTIECKHGLPTGYPAGHHDPSLRITGRVQ